MLHLLLALALADTTPGPGYWQQRVAYTIRASLDESAGVLSGHVRIAYVNTSPDTLRDFYVHQYLNAFRPGSRWAAADSTEGRVRYQHMPDPDYAYERISAATVMGQALAPDYPDAPDSTIAHWTLPRPVAPGRKCVRFYARDVHHFAFSLNPHYVYEQGHYGSVAVHVLYQPQDSATWGKGIAVRNSVIALGWLDS